MRHYDYIIAGSGLAGLYAAWQAAEYGKVALLTKSGITESNSYFAVSTDVLDLSFFKQQKQASENQE